MRELPKPLRAREARQPNGVRVEVPAGERRVVGPFGDYDSVFRIAEVTRFEDLHELRLIPEGVSEREAVDAVIADDRLWEDERQRFRTAAGDCHCSEGPGHASASARASRRMPHLADVFASDYRRPVSIDDPGLMVARNHISRWVSRPPVYLVGVAALAEIHVAENATLVMSPSVHVVNASTITLEDNARLRLEGGSVNVTCDTLNGPSLVLSPFFVDLLTHFALGTSPAENPIDPSELPQDLTAYKYLRGYSREYMFVSADNV